MLHPDLCPPPPFPASLLAGCPAAPRAAALPARVTLQAPAAMRYAELVAALTVAHAHGVRQARVIVERPGLPNPA